MKITIIKKDWKPGLDYNDPCGCLLTRAIKRQEKYREVRVITAGVVEFGAKTWRYNSSRQENRLWLAHGDPSMLPMTIRLNEIEAMSRKAIQARRMSFHQVVGI